MQWLTLLRVVSNASANEDGLISPRLSKKIAARTNPPNAVTSSSCSTRFSEVSIRRAILLLCTIGLCRRNASIRIATPHASVRQPDYMVESFNYLRPYEISPLPSQLQRTIVTTNP